MEAHNSGHEKKNCILNVVVIPRLLYGLDTAWLNVAETRRLNGFYCRCLRAILRIAPAYISRVSNVTVLYQAGQIELSRLLLKRQLVLYGKVARAHVGDPLRDITFCPGTRRAATDHYVRRIGRPRNEWAKMPEKECWKMSPHFDTIIHDSVRWRLEVHNYCMTAG